MSQPASALRGMFTLALVPLLAHKAGSLLSGKTSLMVMDISVRLVHMVARVLINTLPS